MAQSGIQFTIPLFVCMYIGSWSDRFGRKPFLIVTLSGLFLTIGLYTLIVYLEDLTPWWFIAGTMPTMFSGGMSGFMILVSSYIADTSTPKQRALRLSFYDIIFALSSFLGNFTSSYLLYATNYVTVYLVCLAFIGVSLLYTIFFIPESLKKTESEPGAGGQRLQISNIKDTIIDTFKKRPHNGRVHLITILAITLVQHFAVGETNVMTLFLRATMGWTLQKITLFNGVSSVINVVGTVFATVVLYKMLKIKEFHLALFATVLSIIASILRAVATSDAYIYAASVIGTFKGIAAILLRTVTTFIISPQEIGKIFAFTNILTTIDELVSYLVYPSVYNATLNTNSGIFNYISAATAAIGGVMIIYMITVDVVYYKPPTDEEQNQKKMSNSLNNSASEVYKQTVASD